MRNCCWYIAAQRSLNIEMLLNACSDWWRKYSIQVFSLRLLVVTWSFFHLILPDQAALIVSVAVVVMICDQLKYLLPILINEQQCDEGVALASVSYEK